MERMPICKRVGNRDLCSLSWSNELETIIRRHSAEAALQDSEEEFRTLFENNPDPVDPGGRRWKGPEL